MRLYSNQREKNHGQVTGFQSACSEFAQNGLSLDERLDIGNPAIHVLTANMDDISLDIRRGDKLIINTSLRPKFNDLIVVEDKVFRFKTKTGLEDVQIFGVITALIKELA